MKTLKSQEKAMLKEIQKMGLVRDVVHEIFTRPEILGGGLNYYKHPRQIIGITWVRLYTKKQWAKNMKQKPKPFLGGFVAEARANCSVRDVFDKRKGRVVATGRALKGIAKAGAEIERLKVRK